MTSLLYSPGVRVRIFTARNGIIDISNDLESGSVTLNENAVHHATFTLSNPRRKYDGVFTPNDRISIAMKRIRWVQVMTGYLNEVPFYSAYPRSVSISATCSLKKLQYTLWDKGAAASVAFLNNVPNTMGDDTFVARAVGLLTHPEIGRWDEDKVHVGIIPQDWAKDIDTLMSDLTELEVPAELLGSLPMMNGQVGGALPGSIQRPTPSGGFEAAGPGFGELPARQGRVQVDPAVPDWKVQMRWPYLKPAAGNPTAPPYAEAWLNDTQEATARAWWKGTRVLLIDPYTNRSVCCEAGDWGPPAHLGKIMALNQRTIDALGAQPETQIAVRFAPLNTPLGPYGVEPPTPTSGIDTQGPKQTVGLGVTEAVVSTTAVNSLGEITWKPSNKLKANVAAAKQFIEKTWGSPYGIGGWRDASSTKDVEGHPKGLALDVMVTPGGEPTAEQIARGNSIAMWFLQNPNVFGLKYIIWYNRINSKSQPVGWRQYEEGAAEPSPSDSHRNHLHLSFYETNLNGPGSFGGAWPGSSPTDFTGGFASSTGGGTGPYTASLDWAYTEDPESDMLVGPRALMNDNPLLPDIAELFETSMRSWCSAPNGDFIAWWPDYFGLYGLAGRMIVRAIELEDFTINWSDENLKTHQFTSGAFGTGYGSIYSQAYTSDRRAYTYGVVTVEMPNVMKKLLNIPEGDTTGWGDGAKILQRFGARAEYKAMSGLADERAEFWYALYRFQRNWASQFSCDAPITFMPELFPGMLMVLEDYGVQFYVTSVTHSFSFTNSGVFKTSVRIMAPSAANGNGFFGLPQANPIIDPAPPTDEEVG